ncbi:MAG: hypothetical protein Q9183_006744, partial [Haloplaca sp. 2 TL-2023]
GEACPKHPNGKPNVPTSSDATSGDKKKDGKDKDKKDDKDDKDGKKEAVKGKEPTTGKGKEPTTGKGKAKAK